MVVEMFERPDDLSPIGNAFATLRRITNDGTPFQHQHVKTFLCKTLSGALRQVQHQRR